MGAAPKRRVDGDAEARLRDALADAFFAFLKEGTVSNERDPAP